MSLQAQLDRLLPAIPEDAQGNRADHLRINLLDLETRPAVAYKWSLFDHGTPLAMVEDQGGMLSFAAKWYQEPTEFHADWTEGGHAGMVERAWQLLDQADVVVTYNGNRFDLPWLRAEFLTAGLPPPSPFASVDLFATVRQFRFLSKKLDNVVRTLGIGAKVEHEGFDLWRKVLAGDPDAQARMEAYNRGDVDGTLEPLYDALLPWIKNHPHVGLYAEDDTNRCQRCGSTGLEWNGLARTPLGVYRRYRCTRCRSWSRGKHRMAGVDARGIQ